MIVPKIETYSESDFKDTIASALSFTMRFRITKKYCLKRILEITSELVSLKWYQSKSDKIRSLRYWHEEYERLSK